MRSVLSGFPSPKHTQQLTVTTARHHDFQLLQCFGAGLMSACGKALYIYTNTCHEIWNISGTALPDIIEKRLTVSKS